MIERTQKSEITNSNDSNDNKYEFFPKNEKELKKIIKNQIKQFGNTVDLNNIDVSKITNMNSIFYNSEFNGNISKWDVSNVTNMSLLFCKSRFNGNISNWNISKVNNMISMFERSNFNQDISNWDVSNVIDMSWMFYNSEFNQDISNWDINNVINMSYMFKSSKFNKNINNWFTKLNKQCGLISFGKLQNNLINSYNDFKKCHRKNILQKL